MDSFAFAATVKARLDKGEDASAYVWAVIKNSANPLTGLQGCARALTALGGPRPEVPGASAYKWLGLFRRVFSAEMLMDERFWYLFDVWPRRALPSPPSQRPTCELPDPAVKRLYREIRQAFLGALPRVAIAGRDDAVLKAAHAWLAMCSAHYSLPLGFKVTKQNMFVLDPLQAPHITTLFNACCRYAGREWVWGFAIRRPEEIDSCMQAYDRLVDFGVRTHVRISVGLEADDDGVREVGDDEDITQAQWEEMCYDADYYDYYPLLVPNALQLGIRKWVVPSDVAARRALIVCKRARKGYVWTPKFRDWAEISEAQWPLLMS